MKIKEQYSVYSNLIFLIPLYFTVLEQSYVHAGIIFLVFIFSSLFHIMKPTRLVWWNNTKNLTKNQKIFLWLDTIFANILIFFNFYVFYQKGFTLKFYLAIFIALIALVFFFFPNKKRYDLSQGIWHILAGIITLLVVL